MRVPRRFWIQDKTPRHLLSLSDADFASADLVHSFSSNVTISHNGSPFILSSAYTRPLLRLSSLGLSIWFGSPRSTIFDPSPALVMIERIWFGVQFCTSSMMMYVLVIERPLRYETACASMYPLANSSSILSVIWSFVSSGVPNRTSRLSYIPLRRGDIFSCSLPGRNPISSSIMTFDLHTRTRLYMLLSITCSSPQPIAKRVLPVPAGPTHMVRGWSSCGDMSASLRNICPEFLVVRPHGFMSL